MHMPVMDQAALMGDFVGEFSVGDFEDESEVEHNVGAGEGSGGEGEGGVSSRGNGGAIRDRPVKVIPCPRCQSMNTKFCYYNNYSVNQPRHFCRNCQRYWTVGGTLRNVPVGGGSRKKTRTRSRNDAYLVRSDGSPLDSPAVSNSDMTSGLLSANSCMQRLAMLPNTLGGMGFAPFPSCTSQLPLLGGFGASSLLPQMLPKSSPISGLQEVPDLKSFYDVPQVPQLHPVNSAPMMMPSTGFFLPDSQSASAHNDELASVMAKAGLWSTPAQQLQTLTGGRTPSAASWDERPLGGKANSLTSQQSSHLSRYELESRRTDPIGSTPVNPKLAPLQAVFWETALMHSRPLMDDRLVPHVTSNSWSEEPNSRNISPNSSTTEEERCPPSNCFGYHEGVVSQPWVGLQASDILQF